MSLIEYLPEVASSVQRQCSAAATSASLRHDLLVELGQTKLGPVAEADPIGARLLAYSEYFCRTLGTVVFQVLLSALARSVFCKSLQAFLKHPHDWKFPLCFCIFEDRAASLAASFID